MSKNPFEGSSGSQEPDDFLPFADDIVSQLASDEAERRETDSALLDLTGVTSPKSFDELERERWENGMAMARKLEAVGELDLSQKLGKCHSEKTYVQCAGCRKVEMFWNRCDIFYCPQCSPRLSKIRLEGIMWWAESIRAPKHLVLTLRNVPVLTKEFVAKSKKWLAAFRRRKLMRVVTSGIWAMEITNKGKGWHLHFHLVLDSCFIDVREISSAWKSCTEDAGEVVWIEDAAKGGLRANLPRYVTKYAGKGFRPHNWTADQLGEFVRAMEGGRTFGVFGDLLGRRAEWQDWVKISRQSKKVCECGCSEKSYYSQNEWDWHRHYTGFAPSTAALPPPVPQLALGIAVVYPFFYP